MPGRLILTFSAIALFFAGGAALFAPQEVAGLLDSSQSRIIPVVIQLFGGTLLGFAVLNWMSRRNRIGGIYGRPLGLSNLTLFATAALTLGKVASVGSSPVTILGACAVLAMLAGSFAWLVFVHDPVSEPLREKC